MLGLILLVFAFVCAAIAAFWVQGTPRVNFGWPSLMFYLAYVLFGEGGKVFHP